MYCSGLEILFLFYCEQVEVPEKETLTERKCHRTPVKHSIKFHKGIIQYMAVLCKVCHLKSQAQNI
jgi:hypothetical protein